jgi:glyoxylase-like metal-dependent hydrolase (beta-lactamase superfamily II)
MSKIKPSLSVKTFFDPATNTAQHVVYESDSGHAAIIDPVLDFDQASGNVRQTSAQAILNFGKSQGLVFKWILETHAHADHLSAAHFLREATGARTAIGARITDIQKHFVPLFDFEADFACDGSQFDRLLCEGDVLELGGLEIKIIETPGHTPACITYHIGDALFVGDTVFMPDYGSARADFPGGNADDLYTSICKLYDFADETRVFLCHDYLPIGRNAYCFETSIGEEKRNNIHLTPDTSCEDFVALRKSRDAGLCMPKLILPALQVNLRAGQLPPVAENGIAYLKLPLNQFS